ncbi:unannotated protein [freshwater metagenome]|uniref:Unannotated protein n=1 Tax=freshwater metagenome TaxID=449393 RepID=A0A6J6HW12_9ZZZZ
MHQCNCRFHALIREVREELLKLWCCEHALVHNRARRQRREIRAHRAREFVLNALACDENLAVEINIGGTCRIIKEELTHRWHHGASRCTKTIGVHRNITPTERTKTFFGNNFFNRCNCCCYIASRLWEECNTHGIGASSRKIEVNNCAQERIRNLNQNASAVTSVWLCTSCTTVLHVGESSETKRHNLATASTLDVGNKRNATCVVFEPRVIKTVGSGEIWVHERLVLQEPCRARRRMRLFSRGDADPSRDRGYPASPCLTRELEV